MSVRRRVPAAAFLMVALGMVGAARSLIAVDCSVATPNFPPSNGNVFNLSVTGMSNAEVSAAAGYWSCGGYSGYIPTFQIGGTGGIPVTINKVTGNSTDPSGGCGFASVQPQNGEIVSAQITIWTNQSNGVSCEPLYDALAHEFGHLMGEANAPDNACIGHIMGARTSGGTRSVFPDDCALADQMWHTVQEDAPNDPYCEAYGCSPILIDLDGNGLHLTGLDDPVTFDIHANGEPQLLSWTRAGERDAFLALDRDGNGWIDNGGELFGDVTRLANGTRAANGYVALAELDSWLFGGNEDGAIDSADEAFAFLRMWTDLNHDAISQPEELLTLAEAGIQRMDLDYRSSRRTDRYGNKFRYLGRAWEENHRGVVHPVLTWDVFFLVAH